MKTYSYLTHLLLQFSVINIYDLEEKKTGSTTVGSALEMIASFGEKLTRNFLFITAIDLLSYTTL